MKYYPRQNVPPNGPPPIYIAVDDKGECTTHATKLAASAHLEAILEEYHESIAFESDRHHVALDERFSAKAFVREL